MSFPPLRAAPAPAAAALPAVQAVSPVPVPQPVTSGHPPPANRALPLILVALAAGGLPLLWMNRAHMPLPKAWQIAGPNAAGSAVNVAPPVAEPAPAAPPATSVPPGDPAVEAPAKTAAAATPPRAPAHRAPPAQRRDAARPVEVAVPPRTCTEALAALGLCDPRSIGR